MKEPKILLINNGEAIEEKPVTLIVEGNSSLTPRAYNLLNILSKKLAKRIINAVKADDTIIDAIVLLKSLRSTSITLEEYMNKTGLRDYYIARRHLLSSNSELRSFLMSFQSEENKDIEIKPIEDDGTEWKITFIQNLTESGSVNEATSQVDIEFHPDLVKFLVKKYKNREEELKIEEFTADTLLANLMELGLSYIKDYGFEINEEFYKNPEALVDYVRNHYCLGPAPIMT